jgi:serine/threonine protein kinase
MLKEIQHPRVRRLLVYEESSQRLFLEYVEGKNLQDLIQAGTTLKDPARTHRILQSVAEVLADLHGGILCERPMVHNDLKCLNVLVPDAAPEEVVLIDFSHSYPKDCLPPFLTDQREGLVGTAKYMAPEKWEGDHSKGLKGDVFAFGVMAYYAYTGRHPFDGDLATLEMQIRTMTPLSPNKLGVHVLRNTWAAVMSCLAKAPAERPSMESVAKCYADSARLLV